MAEVNGTHIVQKNDCPWNLAVKNLKAQGKKAGNAEIVAEMNRLATLNGCKNVEDFGAKFFNKLGTEIKLTEQDNKEKPTPTARYKANLVTTADTTTLIRHDSLVAKSDATRVAQRDTTEIIETAQRINQSDSTQTTIVSPYEQELAEFKKINSMKNNQAKIIEYNKKHATGNYVIIDKKTCKATVYNKAGQALESYEVLLGSTRGDNMSNAFGKNPNDRTYQTVPGEFTLGKKTNEFGGLYTLGTNAETFDPDTEKRPDAPGSGGKQRLGATFQAIHGTATDNRNKLYGDGNLANNRVSMGCVNIPIDDLAEMEQKYGIKQGSKLYILPEEKGNSLKLEKQIDGTVKFVTEYADKKQNSKRQRVQVRIAQGNIQRQLRAKQKAEQQRLLAQQRAEQEKKDNFRWYNPATWYWS